MNQRRSLLIIFLILVIGAVIVFVVTRPVPAPPPTATATLAPTFTPTPLRVCDTRATNIPLPTASTPVCMYTVVAEYPHDATAFTQGLQFVDGVMYEGTGLDGQSSLRRVDLASGTVEQRVDLDVEYFGEGITVLGERIFQLTWDTSIGFVYDKATFDQLQTFEYPTEGWGLTHDGARLIMSDGSPALYALDPQTLAQSPLVTVADETGPIVLLNELEYINGYVYANVWKTDRIAKIDPASGRVVAWLDLTGLRPAETLNSPEAVLNGIAYDAASDRLFVTGKLWPKLFEIELQPKP